MLARCHNPKSISYPYYGGRGIEVCVEWRESIDAFIAWADASGWRDGLWIDRIDNDGPYSPQNCRWITPAENISRMPKTLKVLIGGVEMSVNDAARMHGVPPSAAYQRIKKLGWDPVRAVTTKVRK